MSTMKCPTELDAARLSALADRLSKAYAQADPYPHIVIDNFLPEDILDQILAEIPADAGNVWRKKSSQTSFKLHCNDRELLGPKTRWLIDQLNSSTVLGFLEKLTGIEHLIPDAHLIGGGLHQILPGGFLKIHADFNKHPAWKLDRRLNALLYLNRNWKEEYGGHFELWDEQMISCRKKVLPVYNRFVVFTTTDTSYHGHPDPLCCPKGWSRKSIALYYYTNGGVEGSTTTSHSTIYQDRPGVDNTRARSSNIIKLKRFVSGLFARGRRAG